MKNTVNSIRKRQQRELAFIKHVGSTDVDTIAQKFNISKVTARHDLDELAKEGAIERYHGGARISGRYLLLTKEDANKEKPHIVVPHDELLEKEERRIAKTAAEMIGNGDVVFINNSRTASYVIEYIENHGVTIVTNNTLVLKRKRPRGIRILFTGGEAIPDSEGLSGAFTLDFLSKVSADICILGVLGISMEGGLCSSSLEDSIVNHKMIDQTKGKVIAIADSSRVGRKSSYRCGPLSMITALITGKDAAEHALDLIREQNVTVLEV